MFLFYTQSPLCLERIPEKAKLMAEPVRSESFIRNKILEQVDTLKKIILVTAID
jgi:hypothetical protein